MRFLNCWLIVRYICVRVGRRKFHLGLDNLFLLKSDYLWRSTLRSNATTVFKWLIVVIWLPCWACHCTHFRARLCRCFRNSWMWTMKWCIVTLSYPWMTSSRSQRFACISCAESDYILLIFRVKQVDRFVCDYCTVTMVNKFLEVFLWLLIGRRFL